MDPIDEVNVAAVQAVIDTYQGANGATLGIPFRTALIATLQLKDGEGQPVHEIVAKYLTEILGYSTETAGWILTRSLEVQVVRENLESFKKAAEAGADLVKLTEHERALLRKASDLGVTADPMAFSAGDRAKLQTVYDALGTDDLPV